MKKLSSDTAFYIMLAQILVGPIFIIGFFFVVPNVPRDVAYIVGALLIILTIRSLVVLFKRCEVFYTDGKFIVYRHFSPGTPVEIPFDNVINIGQKAAIKRTTSVNNIFNITYKDGESIRKVSFLSSPLVSIFQLNNLISDSRQVVKPIPSINIIEKEVGFISIHEQLDAGKRFAAATTDHFIMTLVVMLFGAPLIFQDMYYKLSAPKDFYWYLFIAGFALYFCKDCINGQSVAKRLLKQQVVNNKTGEIANPLRCFVRDIFIIIWPVEVIMILINPSRRLGDKIAGTKVVVFDPELKTQPINYIELGVSYLLSYGILLVLLDLTGTFQHSATGFSFPHTGFSL